MSEERKEEKMLAKVFELKGASAEQALTMAKQLIKRAGQLAKEQNISELEALERLLDRINKAQ